jgi:Holliday junction DNA helicase RuvA
VIAAVSGTVQGKSADRVLVSTASGITYEIAVPIGVLERMPDIGARVSLRTTLVVREDGWALFGFDEAYERDVFQRLLGTTGVGPRLALALVSALGGARVVRSVRESDIAALCTVPGVGKKTAERIVLELKDRLRDIAAPDGEAAGPIAPAEQAVQALMNLGYPAADAERAVRAAVSGGTAAEAVDLIRGALKLLTKAT